MLYRILVVSLCLLLGTMTNTRADAENTVKDANPAIALETPTLPMVQRWIAELDSDVFATREAATQKLENAGAIAVEPLTEAALGDNLEVSSRAIHILFELYREADSAAADAAELGLERLQNGPPSVARRSAQTLSLSGEVRQQRAVRAIEKLGGLVRWISDSQPADFNIQRGNPENTISYVLLGKTWKGGDEGLLHIQRLGERVQTLYVTTGATVTPEALQKLERTLPDLTVQHRGQACLGVSCNLQIPVCQIQFVQEDSAAEKAGLQAGDIITKFGEDDVADFQGLVEMIKQRSAGEKLNITINRRGTTLVREVELEEWRR